jgi:3-methyl-2-oxobutanoate hydroxymethyltransferase
MSDPGLSTVKNPEIKPNTKGGTAMKNTVVTFQQMKDKGEKITMLTAYDYSTAKLVDEAGINSILVGDSLGNVVLGYPDTVSVTMEDMIHHGAAVARGAKDALVIVDMPFLSYQTSVYDAVVNAGRLMKEARAQAVKLEGGEEVCPQIKAITKASIPVCAHIGLTPQSVNMFGGYKSQGRDIAGAKKLVKDALLVQEAGAFAVVLECVPEVLATLISKKLSIPTIGIGAGAGCDGQVLVYADMLAMFSDFRPKFVKAFANVGEAMRAGFRAYDEEVKAGTYPAEEHNYTMDDEVYEELVAYADTL